MTREEYIFKNATQIAEQRIRTARMLQAKEAEVWWSSTYAATRGGVIRWIHGLFGAKSQSS